MTMKPESEAKQKTSGNPEASANSNAAESSANLQTGELTDRVLSPAAKRALAEAEARRKARESDAQLAEKELGGRGGADPARFGDWEIDGRAIDF